MPHHEHHQGQQAPQHAPPEEVTKYLQGAHFPCSKKDLLDTARHNNAPENVIRALEIMYSEIFQSMDDVTRNVQHSEARAEARREHRA